MESLQVHIVDDDPDFAESLAIAIEGRGYDVSIAHSGEEAIQTYRDNDFDIAFFDVILPGKNGVESYMEIRQFKPEARVVMMTGYSMEELIDQAVTNGAWGVLRKPFDMNSIFQILEKLRAGGILIVDDDEEFLRGIQDAINNKGWFTYTAKSGKEAIERVHEGGIDILILDLRMPIMNGLETYLTLKKDGIILPTIIVTAFADAERETISQFGSNNVSGILRKPFDPKELLKLLEQTSKNNSGEAT